MSGRLDIPNLDAMSADELDAWREATEPHRTYRMRVAQEYARRKAIAWRLRLDGDIARAIHMEQGCETLYARLPKKDRW